MCRRVYRLMKLTTRGLAHLVGQLLATARRAVRQQRGTSLAKDTENKGNLLQALRNL